MPRETDNATHGDQNGPALTTAAPEASFVRGGPFYRAQQALRLIHPNQWNLTRRIIVLIA